MHRNKNSKMWCILQLVFTVAVMFTTTTTTTTTTFVSASVFVPYTTVDSVRYSGHPQKRQLSNHLSKGDVHNLRLALRRQQQSSSSFVDATTMAMAIPGYGVAEQVIVGGFGNFLSIYNLVITARILLSWFPQAASIGALQPVYAITDPYLNLFRNIIPPLFGLDFSPILAFLLLNVLTNATAAVGCEIPKGMNTQTISRHHNWMGHQYTSHQKAPDQQRRLITWKVPKNI